MWNFFKRKPAVPVLESTASGNVLRHGGTTLPLTVRAEHAVISAAEHGAPRHFTDATGAAWTVFRVSDGGLLLKAALTYRNVRNRAEISLTADEANTIVAQLKSVVLGETPAPLQEVRK